MPAFSTQVEHQLGREKATERLKGFLEKVRDRYQSQVSNLEGAWSDNVLTFAFTTYGFKIKGTLVADETTVALNGELPFAAIMFKGRIEQSIRDELAKALAAP
jgi:hypothetical protein